MSDTPTKTYPPECLHAIIADHEAEQAGATPEESSAVETKVDAMSDDLVNLSVRWPLRQTKSADTRAVEAYIQQSQRRDRYLGAVKALRDTLVGLQGGQTVSTKHMRDRVVELLDALLDVETEGGTR